VLPWRTLLLAFPWCTFFAVPSLRALARCSLPDHLDTWWPSEHSAPVLRFAVVVSSASSLLHSPASPTRRQNITVTGKQVRILVRFFRLQKNPCNLSPVKTIVFSDVRNYNINFNSATCISLLLLCEDFLCNDQFMRGLKALCELRSQFAKFFLNLPVFNLYYIIGVKWKFNQHVRWLAQLPASAFVTRHFSFPGVALELGKRFRCNCCI
jgi:hypothetical protein